MNKTQNDIISLNIKELREKLGLTQENIAEYLGVSREAVHNYETGKRNVPVGTINRLADLFGVDAYDLYEENPEEQKATLAFAFRANELNPEDMKSIAAFKRIVKNYLNMKKALGNE